MSTALKDNRSVVQDSETYDLLVRLAENGQAHLFDGWPAPGTQDDDKRRLVSQLARLNSQYPGGLEGYLSSARTLLQDSASSKNPFEGCIPTVPVGERLNFGSEEHAAVEEAGMAAMKDAAFVLVAGGLGERLGYAGIKVALPTEMVTETCYLEYYCQFILALQDRANRSHGESDLAVMLPLCIMTSGDTHAQTVALLESSANFGMASDQIVILKQELVPALSNVDASFALDVDDPFTVQTKPHGHGDVHTLLHMSGTAHKWASEGRKWAVFFQDTNALVFRSVPAAIGVSVRNQFAMNSLTVPRKPGEAVGGICTLVHGEGEHRAALTINVEYNQLDSLLRETVSPVGDISDPTTGFSPYPGNINVLIFNVPIYAGALQSTGGSVPEFVNPKYGDKERRTFKKPTRLECMMQDFPKLLSQNSAVGFTQMERWASFSAVKNNAVDALAKYESTGFAESASSGEADLYHAHRKMLAYLGVKVNVDATTTRSFLGLPVSLGAKVVLAPRFGTTMADLASKFPSPDDVRITDRSTLVVDGKNVLIECLDLDGCLIIRAEVGAEVVIKRLKVHNIEAGGFQIVPVEATEEGREVETMRGYRMDHRTGDGIHVIDFRDPGTYIIDQI